MRSDLTLLPTRPQGEHGGQLNPRTGKRLTTSAVPLLVLAWAGSGKTSFDFTRKIAYLVRDAAFKGAKTFVAV